MTEDLRELKGIGEKTAGYFAKLGINSIQDLIYYFPRDYDLAPGLKEINALKAGEDQAVCAKVLSSPSTTRAGNYTVSLVRLGDGSGTAQAVFFNMPYVRSVLKMGQWKVFRGTPCLKGSVWEFRQPKFYDREEYEGIEQRLLPKYALTAGLTHKAVQKAVLQALEREELSDYLPLGLREGFLGRREAFQEIHFPQSAKMLERARKRLAYDEFLLFLLEVRRMKRHSKEAVNLFPMRETPDCAWLMDSLPYKLTNAQKRVFEECAADLCGKGVLNRLIQGDVGSGKTIIAILALLMAVSNGYQAALMAPTEVLAKQHFDEITGMIEKYHLPFTPVLLTGSVKAKLKKANKEALLRGDANLAVGTHAVITDNVQFQNLALVITDEQHRFGVRQREKLMEKGDTPHAIVMSATPIPRTLGMILYGDMDVSLVDELPADRLRIKNAVITSEKRESVVRFLIKQIREGRQAYCICPMIEPSEDSVDPGLFQLGGQMNVSDYAAFLKKALPKEFRIAKLNGRMKPEEKNRIMQSFSEHEIDVLVSTTVVEVGVNVPNATLMVIENAERYGLSALHQLRGRVGRGAYQSYCVFVCGNGKEESLERLQILSQTNNGFEIAEKDLSLRGPGEFFGFRQSGSLPFVLADIYEDAALLKKADADAEKILKEDPELEKEENEPLLLQIRRMGREERYTL